MADETPQDLPVATALAKNAPPERGIVIDPAVVITGSAVALIGIAGLAIFLWMVPSAAARESDSACRGMHGFEKLNPALCRDGKPCDVPVQAPDFTAVDYQGKKVKLSDYRGKVVLLYFWQEY